MKIIKASAEILSPTITNRDEIDGSLEHLELEAYNVFGLICDE